jgi:hypothetical protein
MSEKQKTVSTRQEDDLRYWQMVFETFNASKLSVKQFCKNEGIAEWSFYHWRKKLHQSSCEHSSDEKAIALPEVNSSDLPPAFTQIANLSSVYPPMRIEFPSGICLDISNGCDGQLLHQAIDCLRC